MGHWIFCDCVSWVWTTAQFCFWWTRAFVELLQNKPAHHQWKWAANWTIHWFLDWHWMDSWLIGQFFANVLQLMGMFVNSSSPLKFLIAKFVIVWSSVQPHVKSKWASGWLKMHKLLSLLWCIGWIKCASWGTFQASTSFVHQNHHMISLWLAFMPTEPWKNSQSSNQSWNSQTVRWEEQS